jgi:hypothetical protein
VRKSTTVYFILLFVISFLSRLSFIIIFQFDGLYGQDAYQYYNNSVAVVESLKHFNLPPNFYWPLGYPLIVSLFSLFTAGNVGLAGLLVSLNAGALLPGVIFLLTLELLLNDSSRRSFPEESAIPWAVFAGLIACFSGVLVKSSIVIMSDALGLLWICLAVLFFIKYYRRRRTVPIVFSFIFLALAVMTRYAYVIMLIPLAMYLVYVLISRNSPIVAPQREKIAKQLFFAVFSGVAVFLPQLYYIVKYGVAYLHSEPGTQSWVMSWSLENFFSKDFSLREGIMHYRFWNGLFYLSPILHPLYLSLFGFAFLYGAFTLVKKKNFLILWFCVVWILPFFLHLAGTPFQSLRYTMSFIPALIIISSIGTGAISNRRLRNIFLFIALAAMVIYDVYHLKIFAEQKEKEIEVVRWVDNNVSLDSKLFAFQITAAINHYSKIKAKEFYLADSAGLSQEIENSLGDVYFILPEEQLNTQWKGLPVERNFEFVKLKYNPVVTGDLNNFTVFKILAKE